MFLPRSYQQPDVPLLPKVTAGYLVNVFFSLHLSFHLPLLPFFFFLIKEYEQCQLALSWNLTVLRKICLLEK